MRRLFLLAAAFALFLTTETKAQTYQNALGVRIGDYNGINFKTFTRSNNAWDLNLSFRSRNDIKRFRFTALYQIHNPIAEAPGLQWYYGGGGSIGSVKFRDDESDIFLSADGVLGLDYKFNGAPINLALDWRPRVELTPDTDITAGDIGLAIRFTF
ncbi:MAG TPA: hypothetical protein VGE26_11850 [Sphingobacteriaceae bacterium]